MATSGTAASKVRGYSVAVRQAVLRPIACWLGWRCMQWVILLFLISCFAFPSGSWRRRC